MSWYSKVLGLQTKESSVTSMLISILAGQPAWKTGQNYASYASEGYGANPYVYSCIRLLSTAASGVHWQAMKRDAKDELTPLGDGHPLQMLLNRPNPEMGASKFWQAVVGFLMLSGDTYIERVGPKNKPPLELYPLRPDRMVVLPGNANQRVGGYKYDVGYDHRDFENEDVLHIFFWDPDDDWYGQSPLTAAAKSVDQSNESKAWNVALLQNSARPSGALMAKDIIPDDEFDRLKKELDTYSGNGVGRPMLLEGDLSWTEMGLSPEDMAWLEGQKLSAREIAIVFGVPPELIGDSSNKTYSNYQEARRALYMDTLLPLLDWFQDDLNNWLAPFYGEDVVIVYDKEGIEALQEERSAVWERAFQAIDRGMATINEAREMVGMEPAEEEQADKLIIAQGKSLLEKLGETPPPGMLGGPPLPGQPKPPAGVVTNDTNGQEEQEQPPKEPPKEQEAKMILRVKGQLEPEIFILPDGSKVIVLPEEGDLEGLPFLV